MVDARVAVQHPGFVAVPGLTCVRICVVAQCRLTGSGGQAQVADGGLGQEAGAEEALEENAVRPLLPQAPQHGHRLA